MNEFAEYKEKSGNCAFCGNSPVPHLPTYIFQTFNVFVGLLYKQLVSFKIYRLITKFLRYVFAYVQRIHYPLAQCMGIVTYNNDPKKATTYRSQVIWEEALKRSIPMQQICIFGKPVDIYRMDMQGTFVYFESIPLPPWVDVSDYSWMDDKYLLKIHLAKQNIPVPRCISVTTEAEAVDAYKTFSSAVIVKPRIGSRARHTAVNITNVEQLREAFAIAQQICHFVVIEEYLPGSVCRATVIDGTLRGFLEAHQPLVVGDGVSTIEELVLKKNNMRHERVGEVILTADHDNHLKKQGYSRGSVIEKDVRVELNLHTGRLFGGETKEYGEMIHIDMKSAIERAGKALSAPLVGFDIIVSGNPMEAGVHWGIIEANTLPFIDLHYLPLHGTPTAVAQHIFTLWES
ncbi:MAG: CphA: cyanophycin synthetase [Candidatus Parcubacteria bacterium]|jgi:D-alanine-D-alanine ligase-like ATP-grasp enzyme